MRRPLHFIVPLLAAAALVAAGCGSDDIELLEQLGQRLCGKSTPAAKKIKVGLVTDIGGLNDRSFNQLANLGLTRRRSRAGHRGPRAALASQQRLHPEPVDAGPAEV